MSHRNHHSIPHPLLSPQRADYNGENRFRTTARVMTSTDKEVELELTTTITSPTLTRMVEEQKASIQTLVEAPSTFHRHADRTAQPSHRITLSTERYQGQINLTPYLVAEEETERFKPEGLEPETAALIPEGVPIPRGAILAIGNQLEVTLTQDNSNSIIDLAPASRVERGTFETDLDNDRIIILVNTEDHREINRLRQTGKRDGMVSGIYLHAIDRGIRNLEHHLERGWAQTIQAHLVQEDPGGRYERWAEASEKWAQFLLKNPLSGLITSLQDHDYGN